MKTTFSLLFISILLSACSNKDAQRFDNQTLSENKFSNSTLQEIYNYQNTRNTKEIIPYFTHSKAIYRHAAVLALASVQDPKALNDLLVVLENDKSKKVRIAAAFSIGQIGDSVAQNQLMKLFTKEKSDKVKAEIAESVGKCGDEPGLEFLLNQLTNNNPEQVHNGILLGISRFSLRGIFSPEALEAILQQINNSELSSEGTYIASISLIRLKEYNLNAYVDRLKNTFNNSNDVFTKANIVSALSRADSKKAINFLDSILSSTADYRIKVNAIRSLTTYDYSEAKSSIFDAVNNTNINVAIQASEFFITNGIKEDADKYYQLAKNATNWRVKANLYTSALNYSTFKNNIATEIISTYNASDNIYEKASLLKSLSGDIGSYNFVSQQIHNTNEYVIGTYGMEALVNMRRNPDFDTFNESWQKRTGVNLANEFAYIFKDAVSSGDIAKVGLAAEIIRDPNLNFRKQYKNSYFLTQALHKCQLPKDIETYRELQKTIAYIDGRAEPDFQLPEKGKIEWKSISEIPYNQKITFQTSKGAIQVELFVNHAPVSVANFLKLINLDYYMSKPIHRVVPNFVIQDGCPRGDGWGGPNYAICSEFPLNYFTEGSLGMASAGKDTESSQWFITHSPTPHLDGRYTNFGKVVKGMDVVHQLEVGDILLRIDVN